MSIDVNNESGWTVDERSVLDVARYALQRMRIHPLSELSLIFVDTDAMEQLHIQWMDEPGPTDVLSFPMDELRPGKDDEEPPQGLLGYDHAKPDEEREMFGLQREILESWRTQRAGRAASSDG
jgi:probable rRNA maturation factor